MTPSSKNRSSMRAQFKFDVGPSIVFGFALVAAFASQTYAQGCPLNGKTIRARVTQCSDTACVGPSELRIMFLGAKILYFKNTQENKGQVFYVGQTVSVDKELGLDAPPGERVDAYASAFVVSPNVRLVTWGSLFYQNTGATHLRFIFNIDVNVPSCSSCSVTALDSAFDYIGGSRKQFHLREQSCAISD